MEAKQKDAGKPIVRIDPIIMNEHDIEPGMVVEIRGKKVTAAKVWYGLPEDEDKGIIRMNSIMRKNADVSVGDTVKVRRVDPKPAQLVKLAPVSMALSIDQNFEQYIKQKLKDYVLMEGDLIQVTVLGQPLTFQAVQVKPSNVAAIIDDETQLKLLEKPVENIRVPRITWEDIGDLEEAKQKIRELVELPLRHPELFKYLGIDPPKGILLVGPPGTGKTLLAKAVATETDSYFVAINGPEIVSKYYGESEARLREVFDEAKKNSPAIIFIDEIDSIAPKREEVTGEVEKRIVAQLLTLMDGLQERGQVVVIGATNRPDAVDPALRRPGRFDREITIGMPDKNARREILSVHTRNVPLCSEDDVKNNICNKSDLISLDELAEMTHGYTGADIAALVKEAAMLALREAINNKEPHAREVTMRHFEEAMTRVQPSLTSEIVKHYEDMAKTLRRALRGG